MPAPDERDLSALTTWFAQRIAADESAPVTEMQISDISKPAVGQSSDNWLLTVSWRAADRFHSRRCVIRIQPPPDGIFLEPDAVREARVLRGIRAGSAVPVPAVHWYEADPTVVGRPFFVMEQLDGIVPGGRPSIHAVGWLPTLTPAGRRSVLDASMEWLAALHRIDWPRGHAFLASEYAEPGLRSHLAALDRWYRWTAKGRTYPVTDAALRYLTSYADAVDEGESVLLWGDARLGNTMFDPHTLQVRALLDWELATVGPRGVDLAHWLVFDEFATTAADVPRLEGYPDREDIIARYEEQAGLTVADVEYFEIMQCFFLAATLIRQADISVAAGRLDAATTMGHDNTVTQMIARRLGLPVPPISPDYLRHRRLASPPSAAAEGRW